MKCMILMLKYQVNNNISIVYLQSSQIPLNNPYNIPVREATVIYHMADVEG